MPVSESLLNPVALKRLWFLFKVLFFKKQKKKFHLLGSTSYSVVDRFSSVQQPTFFYGIVFFPTETLAQKIAFFSVAS